MIYWSVTGLSKVNDVWQADMCKAGLLVHSASWGWDFLLKSWKHTNHHVLILTEMIQIGVKLLYSQIHKLLSPISNKEGLPNSGRGLLLYQPQLPKQWTVVIMKKYHWYQVHTYFNWYSSAWILIYYRSYILN